MDLVIVLIVVLQAFKWAPDGIQIDEYVPGDAPVEIDEVGAGVAIENGWAMAYEQSHFEEVLPLDGTAQPGVVLPLPEAELELAEALPLSVVEQEPAGELPLLVVEQELAHEGQSPLVEPATPKRKAKEV